MNKEEYLSALEQELMILPLEERLSALQYYKDYFDDAGIENESQVISELGSPKKIAMDILKDYGEISTEVKSKEKEKNTAETKQYNSNRNFILILLGIFLIPVGLPLLFAAIGLIIGAFTVIFALFLCVLIISVAFLISGVALIIKSVVSFFVSPINSLFTGGFGLFLIGLGLLTGLLFAKICKVAVPAIIRKFVDLCRLPFNRRKGVNL